MMRRLTSSSLAGTSRNDVAVGTPRLRSMFSTILAATPRSGSPATSSVPSAAMPVDFAAAGAAGAGLAAATGAGAPAFTTGSWPVSAVRPVAGRDLSNVLAVTSESRW